MGVSAGTAALISAGVGAAASLGGAAMSSSAANASAQATATENQRLRTSQNEGFTARLNAQLAQTQAQRGVSSETYSARTAAADTTNAAQLKSLSDYRDVLNTENTQAQGFRATGDTAAGTLLSSTTGTTLADAQAAKEAEAAALLAPHIPTGPEPSDPSGTNTVSSDPAYQAASKRRTAEAATNIRNYGSTIGKVASYAAPISTVENAVAANKVAIMPAQTADYLLRSGSSTRLLPSQEAYTAASGEGGAEQTLLKAKGQAGLDEAALTYGNTTAQANLAQADKDTLARNAAAQAKSDADYAASQGKIISGIGQLGLYGAGRIGGLSDIFTPSTGDFSPRPIA
jgi:hypothetical protein